MRLALTCNGPGETAGWLVPLLGAVYAQSPDAEVSVFYVPDDYASGHEPQYVRERFPRARVFDPKEYLRVAIGGAAHIGGVDAVQYLGGDLMHAARLHKRLGGALTTYKFSSRRYSKATRRAFAVDAKNAAQLLNTGVQPETIRVVGNLAVDGALAQALEQIAPGDDGGVLFMPGSRPHEVREMFPFFLTAATYLRREHPGVPIVFGASPFTPPAQIRSALERGGDSRMYSQRGTLDEVDGKTYLVDRAANRFPLVRNAIAHAKRARLCVTIPGTKVIELAAVGCAVLACTPMNAPEKVAINGPLTYLDRVPLVGVPLKRTAVLAYAKRFTYHTQPNMDAGAELVRELHGALTPGRVARVASEMLEDGGGLLAQAAALAELYREHAGAAGRMAEGLLEVCESR